MVLWKSSVKICVVCKTSGFCVSGQDFSMCQRNGAFSKQYARYVEVVRNRVM